MKKNKNRIIIGISVIVILLFTIIFSFLFFPKKEKTLDKVESLKYGNLDMETLSNREDVEKYKSKIIKSYSEYQEILKYYGKEENLTESDLKKHDYLVVIAEMDYCGGSINDIRKVDIQDKKVFIEIGINATCGPCASEFYLYLIPFSKNQIDSKNVEYEYIIENDRNCDSDVSYKPLIYLYPEKEMKVTIRLGSKDKLMTTYPKYSNEWKVLANPNGNLLDLKTNRTYYGLYWEGINTETKYIRDEGFVVKGEDTISFLEEKLSLLGLNEREINEFIIYWLPKMEQNKYNYIYFESMEEINKNMPLNVYPKPDSIIRINMEYKKLDFKIEVKEQNLVTPKRNGFTVVEWGGTVLK